MRGVRCPTIAGPITRGHFPAPAVRRGDAHNGRPDGRDRAQLELQTMIREDLAITEKAPIRVFSWLKAM